MTRSNLVSIFLLFSLVLMGCQSNNLNLSSDVTSIEVYGWGSEELVSTIDEKQFIDELVKKLDDANTGSTANINFQLPDYELRFKNGEETLFEIGYYKRLMDLGVEGRYMDYNKDTIYNVELQLPIE